MIALSLFALKHKLILVEKGEVGFGRPCVGFTYGDSYIAFNPYDMKDYEPIPGFKDDRFNDIKPENAYHKSDCMAVLCPDEDYGAGLEELATWVKALEALDVEVAEYSTGAMGVQAMMTGLFGKAFRIKQS